jgi:prevent-host-death family protein
MTVGAYEAKTHLSDLLDRVSKGERVVITKHGVPVAVLQPPDPAPRRDVKRVIEEIVAFSKEPRHRASHAEIREWIEEGRD